MEEKEPSKKWQALTHEQRVKRLKKQWNLTSPNELGQMVLRQCLQMIDADLFDHGYVWKREEAPSRPGMYTVVVCSHPYGVPGWPWPRAQLFAMTYSASVRHLPGWSLHPVCPMLMWEWSEWNARMFLG